MKPTCASFILFLLTLSKIFKEVRGIYSYELLSAGTLLGTIIMSSSHTVKSFFWVALRQEPEIPAAKHLSLVSYKAFITQGV